MKIRLNSMVAGLSVGVTAAVVVACGLGAYLYSLHHFNTLMEMTRRYDIYGPFGFYDAVDPATGKVAYDQLALDQLMLFLSVTNHLSGGYVPDLFASDPWIKDALPLLAEERFFQ